MPNSERTLRRLRRLGIIVAILGLFTITQAFYFQNRTDDAQECIERKVDAVTRVLEGRSAANIRESAATRLEAAARSKESAATRRVLLAFNDAIAAGADVTEAERQAVIDALAAYDANVDEVREDLAEVREELRAVRQERAGNPVPGFPKGSCEIP